MDEVWQSLFGLGIVLVAASYVLGIAEMAMIRTIHPPRPTSFSSIRATDAQYQNVVVPAMAALFSGLFVSISASFFYQNIVEPGVGWYQYAGLGAFALSAVALVVTLRAALKGAGQASYLANNPFVIRAAAEEYAEDPRRGVLEPDFLAGQLAQWKAHIAARSLNISADVECDVEPILREASKTRGFLRSALPSLRVYLAAFNRFPIRFGFPFLGLVLFILGLLLISSSIPHSTLVNLLTSVFLLVAVFSVVFFGVARGNRARLWYRVNETAVTQAVTALSAALEAQRRLAVDEARRERVLQNADRVLASVEATERDRGGFGLKAGRWSLHINARSNFPRR